MKKFKMIAAALASTVAFASPVFAEWTEVSKGVSGDTFYIDYDIVKENNGYVYFLRLTDLLKPDSEGDLSYKFLLEVDCGNARKFRVLSASYYTQPMASGSTSSSPKVPDEWIYPRPNGMDKALTNAACDYAGK